MKALKHKVKGDQKTEAANLSKQAARVQPSRFLSSFQPWPVRMTDMDIEDWLNSPKRACLVLDEEFIIQLFRPVIQSAILGQKPTPTVPIYSSSAHALDFLTPIKTFSKSDLTDHMNKHRNSEEERRSSRFKLKTGSSCPSGPSETQEPFSFIFPLAWSSALLSTKTNTQLLDLSGARLSQAGSGCQSGPHALSISFLISSLVMSVAPKPSRTSQQVKTSIPSLQSKATSFSPAKPEESQLFKVSLVFRFHRCSASSSCFWRAARNSASFTASLFSTSNPSVIGPLGRRTQTWKSPTNSTSEVFYAWM